MIKKLDKFKQISDIIIADRLSDEAKDIIEKVYTMGLFRTD